MGHQKGQTSRDYNDEASFRMAGAIAWGYDWLYDQLSEDERKQIRHVLLERTRQIAQHVIEHSKIHHVPFDSHAVRSLSSVLVPCCIVLLQEEPELRNRIRLNITCLLLAMGRAGRGLGRKVRCIGRRGWLLLRKR